MNLPNHVKKKPLWWNLIPWLSSFTANAIYPNVYVPKNIYENLKGDNPDPQYISVLIHEETHLKREREIGWFIFGIKYLLLPKFRFNEELIAVKASMNYLKSQGLHCDLSKKAKYLSSWIYLWPVSYDYAKKELEKAWRKQ